MKCITCNYWKQISEPEVEGVCLRFPPIPFQLPSSGGFIYIWSQTFSGQWCGEFEEKMA